MTMVQEAARTQDSLLSTPNTFRDLPNGTSVPSQPKIITVESLYMLRGEEPPTPQLLVPISPTQHDRMTYLYLHEYARGIDTLLETSWFSSSAGLDALLANSRYCEAFVGMLKLFEDTKSDNYDQMRLLPLTESRMIWRLMRMARAQALSGQTPSQPSSLEDAIKRLEVLECLLTGKEYIPPAYQPPILPQHGTQEYRRQLFWRDLGACVSGEPPEAAHYLPSTSQRAEALTRLRGLLDGQENRDVLFSIATVRHLGPRTKGEVNQQPGTVQVGGQLDEDEKARFAVAKKFVEDEASGKGTTQVVQRVCGMAVRSWSALELW